MGEFEGIELSSFVALLTYYSYAILILLGHCRDFLGKITGISRYAAQRPSPGYAILLKSWESFFTRRLYHRIQDCWGRPIASAPGSYIDVLQRSSDDDNKTMKLNGKVKRCLNLGSYDYLGFGNDWKETCRDEVVAALRKWPISMCGSRMDLGSISLHEELEKTIADFIGKESSLVYAMGYGTNLSTIGALMGPGCLIISDSLNHTSIVNGSRSSPAHIRVFQHNDVNSLEEILREAIVHGQPRHHRPWRKILVMVEGIYSMEGTLCDLKSVVRLCKKYKAYLYVDEAHSFGGLGVTGRGICEQTGVNPADVDILMGTFSKSFAGAGGYIAASAEIISYLKASSSGLVYHNSMSPIVCAQIVRAFKILTGADGSDIGKRKLANLRENSNFFREELIKMGLHVLGEKDSAIVPMLMYFPCKLASFSRECMERGVAVVVVGFPATSVVYSRARFCISAGHTRADLVYALDVIREQCDKLFLHYKRNAVGC